MRIARDRRAPLSFVPQGVVEAGCRMVIGERLKQSGMRWSVLGANAILALRCCILSGRFEDFWASGTPWLPLLSRTPQPHFRPFVTGRNIEWLRCGNVSVTQNTLDVLIIYARVSRPGNFDGHREKSETASIKEKSVVASLACERGGLTSAV